MKILFVSMYFYPEKYSSRHILYDLMISLADNGHEVTLLCPNPVRGCKVEFKNKYEHYSFNSINVYRYFCGNSYSSNKLNALLRSFKFSKKIEMHLRKNHDFNSIIIPSYPPLILPGKCLKLCKKHKIKTIYNVNDIFPEVHAFKNKIFNSVLNAISIKYLSMADKIVTLSSDMRNTLISKGINKDKITVIHLWPYSGKETFANKSELNSLNITNDSFNIFYIGNIGKFQSIPLLLEIANEMKKYKDIKFYFVGSGNLVPKVEEFISKYNLENVIYIPRVSEIAAKTLYKRSDLNIISLNRNTIFYACPSKTSMCIEAKVPCLLILDKSIYSSTLTQSKNFYHDSTFNASHIASMILNIKCSKIVAGNNKLDKIFDKNENLIRWNKLIGEN